MPIMYLYGFYNLFTNVLYSFTERIINNSLNFNSSKRFYLNITDGHYTRPSYKLRISILMGEQVKQLKSVNSRILESKHEV